MHSSSDSIPSGQVRLLVDVRPNLTTRVTIYSASPHSSFAEAAFTTPVDTLVSRLRERPPDPTIIYITPRIAAINVSEMLRQGDLLQTESHHAGMRQENRKRVREEFRAYKRETLVAATITFDIGIGHLSIRYISST